MLDRSDINALVALCGGHAQAAERLGVSPVTLRRWEAGAVTPQPRHEGKIRQILAESVQAGEPPQAPDPLEEYRVGVGDALHRVREVLHSHGQLSSRHEALEEVCTLFLAHSVGALVGSGHLGREALLQRASSKGLPLPAALREAAKETLAGHLAASAHSSVGVDDFGLRLADSETKLAGVYIDILEQMPALPAHDSGSLRGAPPVQAYDIMNHLFSQFLADSFLHERELGQYLTPEEVVNAMVDMALADLEESELEGLLSSSPRQAFGYVLDPSCGVASFLTRFVHALFPRARAAMSDAQVSSWLTKLWAELLVGVDKSPRMIKLALASATLFGADKASFLLTNGLARGGEAHPMLARLEGSTGLILTNPPFGAEFAGPELRGFQIAASSQRSFNSEVLFLERHLDWLRDGGRLVSVVPDSILSNKGVYAQLRDMMRSRATLRAVVSLPAVTFGLAGTNTKTSILLMRKQAGAPAAPTYFFVSHSLGYDVVTKGSHRTRVPNGASDIDAAVQGYQASTRGQGSGNGRQVSSAAEAHRWDASYHASLPPRLQALVDGDNGDALRLRDVAEVVNERQDPRRSPEPQFRYIEISGMTASTLRVEASVVPRAKTPSRARKLVHAGDVLVSTVRPKLRNVGVVPAELDRAICTTGLAVLRPRSIDPYLLGRLLQADAVVAQLIRNNVGIAYPAIEESVLPDVVLPVSRAQVPELDALAASVRKALDEAESLRRKGDEAIKATTESWLSAMDGEPEGSG